MSSGGQIEFTIVRHLQRLQQVHDEIAGCTDQCRMAMGEPLRQAASTVAGGWGALTAAVGLDTGHAKGVDHLASHTPAEERTNPDVRRVLRQLPFSNR